MRRDYGASLIEPSAKNLQTRRLAGLMAEAAGFSPQEAAGKPVLSD